MKFKAFTKILDLFGKPVSKENSVFYKFILDSLLVDIPNDPSSDNGESKFQRFMLAERIKNSLDLESPDHLESGQEFDLTPEEVVMVKLRVGKIYTTPVSARLWQILNGS